MGGTSTSTQSQQSQTNPWTAAQPMLQSMLSQVSGNLNNTGLTGAETGALNSVEANAANGNPYAPQIASNATALLNGGGAMNQAGAVNQNYQNYQANMNPLASNTNYDPMQTPGLGTQLQTIQSDVANSVNGMFAGAGRDLSGANQQAYGRGVAQGMAPVITGQYNANVANQQNAANSLFNGGNTNAALLSGMQQQAVQNGQAGTQAASDALNAGNYGSNQILAAEAQRRGIPVQALGLLTQIGVPMAQLGSESTGSSNGSQTMSGAQQFQTIASGIASLGNMFKPAAPTPGTMRF